MDIEKLIEQLNDWNEKHISFDCESVGDIVRRLAAIEDILGDEYELEVLKTIWENYKRGKCVLAPFIQGQLVWLAMDYGLEADEVVENYGVSKLSGGCISGKDVGKIAFSTKAEAEAALRREPAGEYRRVADCHFYSNFL